VKWGHFFNHNYCLGYYARDGLPLNYVTGLSSHAYFSTLNKFNLNIMCPTEDVMSEALLACVKLMYKVGYKSIESVALDLDYSSIVNLLEGRRGGSGVLPFALEEVSATGSRVKYSSCKHDVRFFVADMIQKWKDSIRDYVHGYSDEPPLDVFINSECQKYEILRWKEVYSEHSLSDEFVLKCLSKVRLFYMSSTFNFAIDSTLYAPVNNIFKYFWNTIGIRVQDGGLQHLWDILSGGITSPLKDTWDAIYEAYPELRPRQYAEGDWSKYDFTLLAMVLALLAGFCVPFFSASPDIDEVMLRYILTDFVFNTVFKTMYIHGLGGFYDVWGCMFSGKYITSIGDTLYQMILAMIYLGRLLEKYPDNDVLKLIIANDMIVFAFYGDDHDVSYPLWCNDFLLYDDSENLYSDFISFCTKIFGMNHKASSKFVTDDPYSRVYFVSTDAGFRENLDHPDRFLSLSFLQNRVCDLYLSLDGEKYVYVGVNVYRETVDLVAKLSLSTNSTSDPRLFLCALISQAQLCSGNPEAYSMIARLYESVSKYSPPISEDVWEYFKTLKHGNSIAMLAWSYDESIFPKFDALVARQQHGYKNCEGWKACDQFGFPGDGSVLYTDTGQGVSPYFMDALFS
jgi:RNAse (barnase) inhibitor barstar